MLIHFGADTRKIESNTEYVRVMIYSFWKWFTSFTLIKPQKYSLQLQQIKNISIKFQKLWAKKNSIFLVDDIICSLSEWEF